MKLKIQEFEELSKKKGFEDGKEFFVFLGGGKRAYKVLVANRLIAHDMVKDIYNYLGEYSTKKVIDFGEEGIDGFKAKYIRVGNKLF